jgi:hypothetical protein
MDNINKEISIVKSTVFELGTVELRSDNILTFEPKEGYTTFNLEQIKLVNEVLLDVSGGIPRPYFSNNKNLKSLGSEEKIYIKDKIKEFASAFAMTEESAITRFITYSFMQLSRPDIPVKMFKTKEQAFEWLRTFNN